MRIPSDSKRRNLVNNENVDSNRIKCKLVHSTSQKSGLIKTVSKGQHKLSIGPGSTSASKFQQLG